MKRKTEKSPAAVKIDASPLILPPADTADTILQLSAFKPELAMPLSDPRRHAFSLANGRKVVLTMESSARLEILLTFQKRHSEGHPFQTGATGMKEFARLIPLIEELSREEIETFLVPLMEGLRAELKNCLSCEAKFLVFAEKFCTNIRGYGHKYKRLYKHCVEQTRSEGGKKRDYRGEVEEVITKYRDKDRWDVR